MNVKNTPIKTLEYYLNISYAFEVQPAEEGGFVASIPVLPGCITQAETWEQVKTNIEDARRSWITVAYEDGADIPLPREVKEPSGKFVARVPKSMHRQLNERAETEGVSLNTLVITYCATGLSRSETKATASPSVLFRSMSKDELQNLVCMSDIRKTRGVLIGGNDIATRIPSRSFSYRNLDITKGDFDGTNN